MRGTKFWLAVGIVGAMVVLVLVYMLKTTTVELGIVGAFVGVITLVAGAYFQANVAASDQYHRAEIEKAKAPKE